MWKMEIKHIGEKLNSFGARRCFFLSGKHVDRKALLI